MGGWQGVCVCACVSGQRHRRCGWAVCVWILDHLLAWLPPVQLGVCGWCVCACLMVRVRVDAHLHAWPSRLCYDVCLCGPRVLPQSGAKGRERASGCV